MNGSYNQPIYEINFGEKVYSFDLSQNEKTENCVILSLPGKILVIELKIDENYTFGWNKVKEIRHDDICNLMLMSPESSIKTSNLIFAAVSNHTIKIFSSIMNEDTVLKLRGHENNYLNTVNAICWNNDCSYFASGSDDHKCVIWDDKYSKKEILNFSSSVTGLKFDSEDKDKLLIAEKAGTIFIFCLKIKQSIYSFQTKSPLMYVDWSKNFIVALSGDQVVYFDVAKPEVPVYAKRVQNDIGKIVKISPNNPLITASVGSRSGTDVRVVHQKSQIPLLEAKLLSYGGLSWHLNLPYLVAASDRKLSFWKLSTV